MHSEQYFTKIAFFLHLSRGRRQAKKKKRGKNFFFLSPFSGSTLCIRKNKDESTRKEEEREKKYVREKER